MPKQEKIRECIACHGSSFRPIYQVNDANQGVEGTWDLMVCETCGLGFIEPFPSSDQIESFYADVFYTDEGQRFQGWVEYLRSLLARIRGKDLNRIIPGHGRLLDYGAGTGHFAQAQRKRGWEVFAIDPYSSKADGGHCERDGDAIRLKFPDNYFDAVTLWYVIEHLRDPDSAINEFKRVLKPGGILLLAQQDFGSIQAKIFGPRWLILDPPRHIWQFSENNLLELAAQHGFTKRMVTHSSLELGPFTILQSMLNCVLGNQNYLFCLLKNGGLRSGKNGKKLPAGRAVASIILGGMLIPIALVVYYFLLLFKSGDVFILYMTGETSQKWSDDIT
ncbi:MAG: class I SAM-dependent methyltransferase [Syntrophorhabdaceae bacterium]